MKKYIFTIVFLLAGGALIHGQTSDPLVSSCVINAGPNSKYLKDFRIELGKAPSSGDFRYKAQMSLWKNTKYKFTQCNADDSKGKLVLTIKDDANKIVLSSFDQKSGKIYPYIEFICNKSGIYVLNYDFLDGQQGSAVGVVSMVR
jgi:major membrane immunogen (membrane-anchored lipoprotein)